MHKIEIDDVDRILVDEPGRIGSGGNSGFQALNIAVQFGATRILGIGYDLHGANGLHWYGRNIGHGRNNPEDRHFIHWRKALQDVAPELARRGIEFINASPISAVTCFPVMGIEEALEKWGL